MVHGPGRCAREHECQQVVLSRKSQVDSRGVQDAALVDVAQHDYKRAILDLVHLRWFSELCPLRGAVVGNLPRIV